MGENGVQQMDHQPRSAQKQRHKPSFWIRPQISSLEIENHTFHHIAPLRAPTLKNVMRLALNCCSVLIILVGVFFIASAVVTNARTGKGIAKTAETLNCSEINRCFMHVRSTLTPSAPGVVTPSPTVYATPVHAVVPTKTSTPTPTSTPDPATLSPTVAVTIVPLKATPALLSFSLTSSCSIRKIIAPALTLQLANIGSSTLTWSEDKNLSSPEIKRAISIFDPTGTHLLLPGMSVQASVSCHLVRLLIAGTYTMVIDYNGGVIDVGIEIIA